MGYHSIGLEPIPCALSCPERYLWAGLKIECFLLLAHLFSGLPVNLLYFFYIIYLFSLLFLFFTRRVSLFVVIIEVFVEKMEDDMFKLLPFSRRKGSAAMHYTGFGKRAQATPQTEPIPGSQQVANNAGGFSFQIDDMQRLQRFLILGSSSNTY
jgi:hypothetical protein